MTARLQRWLDTVSIASPQRWALGTVAVAAVTAAVVAGEIGSGDRIGWLSVAIVTLATVAAIQAGSHTSLAVVALVVVQWLSATDDVTTVRSLVVAVGLLTFHTLLALMAVTPHSATVHPAILWRWVRRSGLVAVATTGVWVLVRVFERRESEANPHLTLIALLVAGAGVVTLLMRSLDDGGR